MIKTFAAQIPYLSAGTEILNQLEGEKVSDRLSELEIALQRLANVRASGENVPGRSVVHDWSVAAGEFHKRTVALAVVYDGRVDGSSSTGRERFLVVAHGCLIAPNEVVTSNEALQMLNGVTEHKRGRRVVLIGPAWYECRAAGEKSDSGLCLLKLTNRDETKAQQVSELFRKVGLGDPPDPNALPRVRHSFRPYIGTEIGFIHIGEAEDAANELTMFYHLQFETAQISYFRRRSLSTLSTFITTVLPSRFVYLGSPVFDREATLLGIIAGDDRLPSDAGRRAVVRGLLGDRNFQLASSAKSSA